MRLPSSRRPDSGPPSPSDPPSTPTPASSQRWTLSSPLPLSSGSRVYSRTAEAGPSMTASSFRQGRTCDNAGAMNTPTDLRSPYQPPNADLTGPPQVLPPLQEHERSGAPKVFGVLSIIFASIVLLSSSLGMLATLATSAATSMGKMVPDPEKAAEVT